MSKQLKGHDIRQIEDGSYVYCDTGEPVKDNHKKRTCGICDMHFTPEGHDPCLGTLIGLMNACCGHKGTHSGAYVQFLDGSTVQGEDAITIQAILKKHS